MNRERAVNRASLVLLVLTLLASPSTAPAAAALPAFQVHALTLPQAAYVNAYVIETSGHVVVLDAAFSDEEAARIRARVQATGKPLRAILLTHGHVDHYGGVAALRRAGVPVITGAGVARQIDEYDRTNYARFGMAPPAGDRRPDRILGDRESLQVDGVTFTLHDAGPGESYSDVWWQVSGGGRTAAFIGDLAMYGLPPFLQSGHSGDWMRSLEILRARLAPEVAVYIGHDVEAAGKPDAARDRGIVDWQIARLRDYREAVAAITKGSRLLAPGEIDAVVARLHGEAPELRPEFDFLVRTSANVLAAELIAEAQKEQFEKSLQALFADLRP